MLQSGKITVKRLWCLLLCVLLATGAFSATSVTSGALAANGSCGSNVVYEFDAASGQLRLSGTGATYDYLNTRIVGNSPFLSDTAIKSVVIGYGITELGTGLFSKCTSLKSVTMANSVTKLGRLTFSGCSAIKHIALSSNLESIGELCFSECTALTDVIVPKALQKISMSAFSGCSGLCFIFYGGSVADWKAVSVATPNNVLKNAIMHYESTGHSYQKNITPATTAKNGTVISKCSVCKIQESKTVIQKIKKVSLSATRFPYSAKVITPKVKALDAAGKTIAAKYYAVSFAKGRKAVGRYTVKVTMKGNYKGTFTLAFDIVPKTTKIVSVSRPAKAQFAIKWNKVSGINGYQVQTATSKDFKKNARLYSCKPASVNARFKKAIRSKTTYYIRIRSYKAVKYNNKNLVLYSNWSAAKSVKTK